MGNIRTMKRIELIPIHILVSALPNHVHKGLLQLFCSFLLSKMES